MLKCLSGRQNGWESRRLSSGVYGLGNRKGLTSLKAHWDLASPPDSRLRMQGGLEFGASGLSVLSADAKVLIIREFMV